MRRAGEKVQTQGHHHLNLTEALCFTKSGLLTATLCGLLTSVFSVLLNLPLSFVFGTMCCIRKPSPTHYEKYSYGTFFYTVVPRLLRVLRSKNHLILYTELTDQETKCADQDQDPILRFSCSVKVRSPGRPALPPLVRDHCIHYFANCYIASSIHNFYPCPISLTFYLKNICE